LSGAEGLATLSPDSGKRGKTKEITALSRVRERGNRVAVGEGFNHIAMTVLLITNRTSRIIRASE
ncbi:MAG: hypothetical protein ACRD2G_14870, partial [Terriglobia bacterium]